MPLRAASIAAAIGLLALLAAIAVAGAQSKQRSLGTNGVRPLVFAGTVEADQTLCQPKETVPAKTAGVQLQLATNGAPTPQLTVSLNGRRGASLRAGWAEGLVVVPVPHAVTESTNVRLCVTNGGPAAVQIAGENYNPEWNASVGTTAQPGRIRVEYEPDGERSWWANLGAVTERLNIVRGSLPGIAALPLYILLAVLVAGGAVALVLREARE